MKTKMLILGIVALVLASLLLVARGAIAQPGDDRVETGGESSQPSTASQILISYQGTLTDSDGAPINDTLPMQFALYDAPSEGNLKWGPEPQTVKVGNGQFHVVLGTTSPIIPSTLSPDLYLWIEVNGEELTPRELLTSVMDSVRAVGIVGDLDMRGQDIRNVAWLGSSSGAELGVQANGGGRLVLANNPGDNKIYVEAFSADGSASASELLFTGRLSSNAPVISFLADKTNFRGDLDMNGHWVRNVTEMRSPAGSDLVIDPGDGDQRTVLLLDAISAFGNINMNGHSITNCGALTEANLQTEEERAAESLLRFEKGDVLCWAGERLEKCATANDRLVQAVADANGKPIIIGAEVIKVLGLVRYGDLLVASDVPGYAMVNNDPRAGAVIAQALQDFDGERGIIKAMIRKF